MSTNSICENRGGVLINKPEFVDEKKVKTYDEIGQLLSIYKDLNEIDFSKLPTSAKKQILTAKTRHRRGCLGRCAAIDIVYDVLATGKYSKADKAIVDEYINQLQKVRDEYGRVLDKANPSVAPEVRDSYIETELSSQEGLLYNRARDAAKQVIVELARGVSKDEGWVEGLTEEEVNKQVKAECLPGVVEEKAPTTEPSLAVALVTSQAAQKTVTTTPWTSATMATVKKGWDKANPTLSFDLRSGVGYLGLAKPKESFPYFSHQGRVAWFGGASVRGRVLDHLFLQADYRNEEYLNGFKLIQKPNLLSNEDEVRISSYVIPFEQTPILDRVGAYIMISGRYYRSDLPSASDPNENVVTEKIRLSGEVIKADEPREINVSLNIDQNLSFGNVEEKYPAHPAFGAGVPVGTTRDETREYPRSMRLVNFGLTPGLSVKYSPLIAFAGFGGGYEMNNLTFGPYVGTGLSFQYFQADFAAQNSHYVEIGSLNSYSQLKIQGRVFVDYYFGLLGAHAYADYSQAKPQEVKGELFGQVKLLSFIPISRKIISEDKDLILQVYAGVRTEPRLGRPNQVDPYLGVMLRLGGLPFSELSDLRPYSTVALPEER